MLQLQEISVHYGGVKALDEIDVSLDEGEIVALMGPNGAGKSTILKVIFGLAPIHSGKVLWHEKAFEPISYQVAQRGIAFVPQGRRVFTHLTVEENLEIGGFTVRNKNYLKRRIEEVMEIFGVKEGPLVGEIMKEMDELVSSGEARTRRRAIEIVKKGRAKKG